MAIVNVLPLARNSHHDRHRIPVPAQAGRQDEYSPMATHMSQLARDIPGYISHKGFVADDGERVTIVEFETEDALQAWRIHPDHAKAKRKGIDTFFSDYAFQICNVIRARSWTAKIR